MAEPNKPEPNKPSERSGSPTDFSLGGLGRRFTQTVALADYIRNLIYEQATWNSLVPAIRDEFQDVLPRGPLPTVSVILAEHPLLGLAGAAVLGPPAVRVPRLEAERDAQLGTLALDLGKDSGLLDWLNMIPADLDGGDAPLLMRAWGAAPARVARELAGVAGQRAAERKVNAICLMRAEPGSAGQLDGHVLLDLTRRTEHIVARCVVGLNLVRFPRGETVGLAHELITEILQELGVPLERILRALNTPFHSEFRRLAMRLDVRRQRLTSERFRRFVTPDKEDTPRHAACLFIASHFGQLTPAQFIELGDMLAPNTPTLQPAVEAARPPPLITDQVLRACGVRFERTPKGLVSVLTAGDDAETGSDLSDEEAIRQDSAIREGFDNDAWLLKERYLEQMAIRLTLGNASDAIADRYIDLELEAVDEWAGMDLAALSERMRRIVFGYPAVLGASSEYFAANRPKLMAALRRSIQRAPEFVQKVAARVPGMPLPDIVRALVAAEPMDPDESWTNIFDECSSRLFWHLYSADPAGVTLRPLDCLFEAGHGKGLTKGGTNRSEDGSARDAEDGSARRRKAAIENLRNICLQEGVDRDLETLRSRFSEPLLLARLLQDIGVEHRRIIQRSDEPFRADLLLMATSEFLNHGLFGQRWNDVVPWPERGDADATSAPDRRLASALFSRETRDWLGIPADHVRRLIETEAMEQDEATYAVGYLFWRLAHLALDGIVGSAAFGEQEWAALDIGLHGFLGDESYNQLQGPSFIAARLWQDFSNPATDDEKLDAERVFAHYVNDEDADAERLFAERVRLDAERLLSKRAQLDAERRFAERVQRLHRMIPVLVLMAMTRDLKAAANGRIAFRFSEPVKECLIGNSVLDAPVLWISDVVAQAKELQGYWRDIHSLPMYQIPWRGLPAIRSAFTDRVTALQVFEDAIRPLQQAASQRGGTAKSPPPGVNSPTTGPGTGDCAQARVPPATRPDTAAVATRTTNPVPATPPLISSVDTRFSA